MTGAFIYESTSRIRNRETAWKLCKTSRREKFNVLGCFSFCGLLSNYHGCVGRGGAPGSGASWGPGVGGSLLPCDGGGATVGLPPPHPTTDPATTPAVPGQVGSTTTNSQVYLRGELHWTLLQKQVGLIA